MRQRLTELKCVLQSRMIQCGTHANKDDSAVGREEGPEGGAVKVVINAAGAEVN